MGKSNTNNANIITLQNQWRADSPMPWTGRGMLRMLFCRQDNVTVSLNGALYELSNENILIAFPGDSIKVIGYGQSFVGCYLSVPQKVLEQFSLFSPQNWRTYCIIKDKRQLCLEESNIQILQSYLHLLEARSNHPALADNNAGLYAILSTFIRDFLNIAAKQFRNPDYWELSAANSLFNRFIHLLYASAPRKAEVGYYADRLCITPKYLSTVCKQVAGETATSIINSCLTNEIRNRLMDPDKPIQAIAYELGFANQSFFGKYVKAHLGMTASQFRESNCCR